MLSFQLRTGDAHGSGESWVDPVTWECWKPATSGCFLLIYCWFMHENDVHDVSWLIHAWKWYENNMKIIKLFILLHKGPLIYPPLMGCWTPFSTWSRWWRLSSLSAPTTNGGFVWTSLSFAEKPHFEPNPPVSSQWLKTPSFTCKLGHWLLSIFTAERLSWHTGNINWELFQTANLRVPKFAYLGWNSTRLRGLIDWQTHDTKTSNPKVTKTLQSKPQVKLGSFHLIKPKWAEWCPNRFLHYRWLLPVFKCSSNSPQPKRGIRILQAPAASQTSPTQTCPSHERVCWNMIHCLQQVLDQNFGITFLERGQQKQSEMEDISNKLLVCHKDQSNKFISSGYLRWMAR